MTRQRRLRPQLRLRRLPTGGDLDHTFSGDGKMVRSTSLGGGLSALHVLDSGRIVAAGTTVKSQTGDQFLVEKYKRDGTFDTSFGGGDGAAVTGFKTGGESRDDFGLDMAVQSDGKIVVAGESIGTDKRFAVVRYTSAASSTRPSAVGGS